MTRRSSRPAGRATDREVGVVAAVLVAGSEKAAAHRLGLSHSTVKHHLANARSKVGAATTAQLVWILAPRLPEADALSTELQARGPNDTAERRHTFGFRDRCLVSVRSGSTPPSAGSRPSLPLRGRPDQGCPRSRTDHQVNAVDVEDPDVSAVSRRSAGNSPRHRRVPKVLPAVAIDRHVCVSP